MVLVDVDQIEDDKNPPLIAQLGHLERHNLKIHHQTKVMFGRKRAIIQKGHREGVLSLPAIVLPTTTWDSAQPFSLTSFTIFIIKL